MNHPRLAIVLMLVACGAATGCHEGTLRGTGASCDPDNPCRGGFMCVDQHCHAELVAAQDAGSDAPMVSADSADTSPETLPPDVDGDVSPSDTGVPEATETSDGLAGDAGDTDDLGDLGSDGTVDGDAERDAQDDGDAPSLPASFDPYPPRPCDTSKPFGPPSLIQNLDDPATNIFDVTPRLSYDELTLYFSSARPGGPSIYAATREFRTDSFAAPTLLPNISGDYADQEPSITGDGLTLYFETTRSGGYSINKTTRIDLQHSWQVPQRVASISPGNSTGDGGVYISPDGSVVYFHSTRAGWLDIYRATADGDGFGDVQPISSINTSAGEERPALSSDQLTIVYASDRSDGGAKGQWDIWMATRPNRQVEFDPPINIQELNTPDEETPGWISADKCDLYFQRAGAQGSRLYVASRPPLTNPDGGSSD